MEVLRKPFTYLFVIITLSGISSISAQDMTTTVTTTMNMDAREITTRTTEETPTTTSGEKTVTPQGDMSTASLGQSTEEATSDNETTTQTVSMRAETSSSGGSLVSGGNVTENATQVTITSRVTSSEGSPAVSGGNVTENATQVTITSRVTSSEGSPAKQCYTCTHSINTDKENDCAEEQTETSRAEACDGQCLVTTFLEDEGFFNVSRSCSNQTCSEINQEDYECKEVELGGSKKIMCTFCCSTDKCNARPAADASGLRYNGVVLMVTIVASGIFYYHEMI